MTVARGRRVRPAGMAKPHRFPGLASAPASGAAVGVAAAGGHGLVRARVRRRLPADPEAELDTGVVLAAQRLTWRMSPLAELSRPAWSPRHRAGMIGLRLYLLIAVGLVVVKIVQLAVAG